MKLFRHLTLLLIPLGVSFVALAAEQPASESAAFSEHHEHDSPWHKSPLVQKVRKATARYKDINVALGEGWVPATPCVSGPNTGAMGVHFVKGERIGDGVLRADKPEALIYEPMANGAMRLVGVEFIEIAEVWDTQVGGQPTLEGHLLNLVSGPNRYALPAFYEIHVWAWERNPEGSFADWNTQVSCERQPLD
ncbi:MAG TPA: hypothetical protein VLD59_08405 [Steroidobacteraceae bacterium]|nr:hypothetical protein [Steroidobacteraceae bacterium]